MYYEDNTVYTKEGQRKKHESEGGVGKYRGYRVGIEKVEWG